MLKSHSVLITDDSLRAYFEDVLGDTTEKARFIGREEGGRVLGVAAVYNFDGRSCEAAWCGDKGWMTLGFLNLLHDYIFNQLGCARCTALIDASNETAIKQAERVGFKREGCLREGAEDGDVYVYGMLKKDYRYGKERR